MNSPLGAIVTQLGNSRSITHGVVSTVATAALTLINPRTLTPGKRLIYRATLAGLTGWITWTAMREDTTEVPVPTEVKVGVTTAAAGAVMGAAELAEALDGKLHDGLLKRGARRPRVWLAAATFVLGGATWLLDRKSGRSFDREVPELPSL